MDLAGLVADRGCFVDGLVRVDAFLNHRVEPAVLMAFGEAIASATASVGYNLVLTAEASGIPIASSVSMVTGIPFVYAKKIDPMETRDGFHRHITSPTRKRPTQLWVSDTALLPAGSARTGTGKGMRILIVDDFLSAGGSAEALAEMVEESGGIVSGIWVAIEKAYEHGRERLEKRGWDVGSVVRIIAADDDGLVVEGP